MKGLIRNYLMSKLVSVLLIGTLHATVTTTQHSNAFGAATYNENPYAYLPVDNLMEVTEVDGSLNFRVHPLGTYMLYDQNLLLCGRPVEKLEGVKFPFLITYERVAHRSVRGVGCHDLLRIDNIEPKEVLGK